MSWSFRPCRGCKGCRGEIKACRGVHLVGRGAQVCRRSMSWITYVVRGCREKSDRMPWITGMSWKYVVENNISGGCRGDVGTEVVCRGS